MSLLGIDLDIAPGSRAVVLGNLLLRKDRPSEDAASFLKSATSDLTSEDFVIVLGNLFDPDQGVVEARELATSSPVMAQLAAVPASAVIVPGDSERELFANNDLSTSFAIPLTVADGVNLRYHAGGRPASLRLEAGTPRENLPDAIVRRSVLGRLAAQTRYLEDALDLDPGEPISRYLVSRTLYHRMRALAPWILLPLAAVTAIRIPILLNLPVLSHLRNSPVLGRGSLIAVTFILDLLLVIAVSIATSRALLGILDQPLASAFGAADANAADRLRLDDYLSQGYSGLISGAGMSAELAQVGAGVYACPGIFRETVKPVQLRVPFMPIYRRVHSVTWLEIEGGAELRMRLQESGSEPFPRLLGRLAFRPTTASRTLASVPEGPRWPRLQDALGKSASSRRLVAAILAIAGLAELVSALLPPLSRHLHLIHTVIPELPAFPRYADAISAAAGVALIALADGLRQGQRRSFQISLALLAIAIFSNVARGLNLVATVLLLSAALALYMRRGAFDQPGSERRRIASVIRVAVTAAILLAVATLASLIDHVALHRGAPYSLTHAIVAIASSAAGLASGVPPPFNRGKFQDALTLSGVVLLFALVWSVLAPYRKRIPADLLELPRESEAKRILQRYAQGTLDYFAIREDKVHRIRHSTLIAYGDFGSTVIVSPDPIGPSARARHEFAEFYHETVRSGRAVAILGASREWEQAYRELKMRTFYIGDEALVTLSPLNLSGKAHKSLRQAVSRMTKYGYTVKILNPLDLDESQRREVLAVMRESRRGDRERGFSMTLGRIFDPRDNELLMSVCTGPDGRISGFCQWVPAPAVEGYSLDLMRRNLQNHPNGMFDLLIVETIRELHLRGFKHLSLNFAAMRAVLASTEEASLGVRMERWMLGRLSDSMQIESLFRFNSKFDPEWEPRFLAIDAIEHLPQIAIAVARAESLWDLPIIGRLISDGEQPRLG